MANLKDVKTIFTVEGADRVIASFKSIAQAAIDANKKQLAAIKQSSKAQVTEAKSAEKAITAEIKKGGKDREKAKEQEYKALIGETKKWANQELAEVKRANKAVEAESKRSASAREAIAKRSASVIAGAASKAISPVVTGAKIAGAALTAVGLDAVRQGVSNRASAKSVSVQSGYYEGDANGVDSEAVITEAKRIAKKYGTSVESVLNGMQRGMGISGNGKKTLAMSDRLNQLALISGASPEDVQNFAGDILSKDENLKPEQIYALVQRQIAQSEKAGIESKDFAQYGTRANASAASFGGGIEKNLPSVMAAAQLARKYGDASDSAEALTAANRLGERMFSHAPEISKWVQKAYGGKGGSIIDKKTGQINDFDQALLGSVIGSHGDKVALHEAFGERGGRITGGLANVYNESMAQTYKANPKTSEKEARRIAAEATTAAYNELKNQSLSNEDVDNRAKKILEEDEKKIATSMEELYDMMDKELTPAFRELIPVLKEVIPLIRTGLQELVPYLKGAIEHPFLALIAYMSASFGASIATELAKAGIAKVLETGITKALTEAAVARGVQSAAIAGGASGTGAAATGAEGGLASRALGGFRFLAGLATLAYTAACGDNERAKVTAGELAGGDSKAAAISEMDAAILGSNDSDTKKAYSQQRRQMLQAMLDDNATPEDDGTASDKESLRAVIGKFDENGNLMSGFEAIEKSSERLAKANNEAAAAAERLALVPPPPTTTPPPNGKGQ